MTSSHHSVEGTRELLAGLGKDTRMVVRTSDPLNIETVIDALDEVITPTSLFFVRNNDTWPSIEASSWQLTIDGHVARSLTITYDMLRQLPTTRLVSVLECYGNGRARFANGEQQPEGIPWVNGAVGNAVWEGVPVRVLLEQVGVLSGAVQIECMGGDSAHTTRGVDIEKLLDDAILAHTMNGEPLSVLHGGPVRLVVPGWGGINWIKWIERMRVITHESKSKYNQQKYIMVNEDGETTGKVRELQVKSVLNSVVAGMYLAPGRHVVRGFAWSSGCGIDRVDVSPDGGRTWHSARLLDDLGPQAWRQFEWLWEASPGTYLLGARAVDSAECVQPHAVAFNHHGYMMNAIEYVSVVVGELAGHGDT